MCSVLLYWIAASGIGSVQADARGRPMPTMNTTEVYTLSSDPSRNGYLISADGSLTSEAEDKRRRTANERQLSAGVKDKSAVPPPAVTTIYLSTDSGGTVRGIRYKDEDILAYDVRTDTWSVFFDGSDVGLNAKDADVDALNIRPDGSILLSFHKPPAAGIPGVGAVEGSDIVRFTPTATGSETAGTYEWYFNGSEVGLEGSTENVDALGFAPDGRLVLSTRGSFNVTGVSGSDEDLLVFTDRSFGKATAGFWKMYFEGSDVGLNDGGGDEDILGIWIDEANGDIYLTTRGKFSVPGMSGDAADIFICAPGALGSQTSCASRPFWDANQDGLEAGEVIDGFSLVH